MAYGKCLARSFWADDQVLGLNVYIANIYFVTSMNVLTPERVEKWYGLRLATPRAYA